MDKSSTTLISAKLLCASQIRETKLINRQPVSTIRPTNMAGGNFQQQLPCQRSPLCSQHHQHHYQLKKNNYNWVFSYNIINIIDVMRIYSTDALTELIIIIATPNQLATIRCGAHHLHSLLIDCHERGSNINH